MKQTLLKIFTSPTWSVITAVALGVTLGLVPELVMAQFYNGPGIVGGINQAQTVGGVTGRGLREVILDLLLAVLLFMGLAAVVVIVVAGIYMVVSVGDEQAKEKAKKIILYAVIGLIIIALAAAIVLFVINATGGGGIFGPVPNLGTGTDLRTTVLRILFGVLAFLALAAVVVIVIAGIYMVVSVGDEQAKDRAKRIILYAVIGLLIVALAAAIVLFVIQATGAEGLFGPVPDLGTGTDVRGTVLAILRGVLRFMALIAVVVIVIAGIYLVISLGDEQVKDRAKRIIFYAVIGLLIILFAEAIVGFIASIADDVT